MPFRTDDMAARVEWAKKVVKTYVACNDFDFSLELAQKNEKNSFFEDALNSEPDNRLNLSPDNVEPTRMFYFGTSYGSTIPYSKKRLMKETHIKNWDVASRVLKAFRIPVDRKYFNEYGVANDIEGRFCCRFIYTIYKALANKKGGVNCLYNKKNMKLKPKGYEFIFTLLSEIRYELKDSFLEKADIVMREIVQTRFINYAVLFSIGKPSQPIGGTLTKEKINEYLDDISNNLLEATDTFDVLDKYADKKVTLNFVEKSYLALLGLMAKNENSIMVKELKRVLTKFKNLYTKEHIELLVKIHKADGLDVSMETLATGEDKLISCIKSKYGDFLLHRLRDNADKDCWHRCLKKAFSLAMLTNEIEWEKMPVRSFLVNLIVADAMQKVYIVGDNDVILQGETAKFSNHDHYQIFSSHNLLKLCQSIETDSVPRLNYLQWLEDTSKSVDSYTQQKIKIFDKLFVCIADLIAVFSEAACNSCVEKILDVINKMDALSQNIYTSSNLVLFSEVPILLMQWELRFAILASFMFCRNTALVANATEGGLEYPRSIKRDMTKIADFRNFEWPDTIGLKRNVLEYYLRTKLPSQADQMLKGKINYIK